MRSQMVSMGGRTWRVSEIQRRERSQFRRRPCPQMRREGSLHVKCEAEMGPVRGIEEKASPDQRRLGLCLGANRSKDTEDTGKICFRSVTAGGMHSPSTIPGCRNVCNALCSHRAFSPYS